MHKHVASEILFWALLTVAAALLGGLVLAMGGIVPVESVGAESATRRQANDVAPRATEVEPPATAAVPRRQQPATRTTRAAPATLPGKMTVVVTATRGESWFSARLGSESGALLAERVLALGESTRFEGRRIWLSVGAAGNVDVVVDGKPRELGPGTVTLVLTGAPG
jgi:hypothetical protein